MEARKAFDREIYDAFVYVVAAFPLNYALTEHSLCVLGEYVRYDQSSVLTHQLLCSLSTQSIRCARSDRSVSCQILKKKNM